MKHYRARSFRRWLGPPRAIRAQAVTDAIEAGEARRDEHSGNLYWSVGAEIIDTPARGNLT